MRGLYLAWTIRVDLPRKVPRVLQRRLNILRVITWLPVGGIERRLVAVLPRIDRERFNVQLVCIRERGPLADELEAAGIRVHCIPFKTRWDPRALWKLSRLMRSQQIDLVHSHMYRSNVPATVAARLAGIPRVWGQVHNVGTWETARQAAMDRWLCRWRSGMIAVSERVRDDVRARLGLAAERVRVIYNGVDVDRFEAARQQRAALRAELSPACCVLLFAARMVAQKRPLELLRVFGQLQRDAPAGAPPLRLWMLGDGPLLEAARSAAAQLPDPDAVQFFGRRDDVEQFMAAADVFVLASTREGFSNAIVEALASGLPVVASDVGGNAEAVRDGVEGRIVPPQDDGALAAALRQLWLEPTTRRAMALAATGRAREFSLPRMIAAIEQLYAESCAGITHGQ